MKGRAKKIIAAKSSAAVHVNESSAPRSENRPPGWLIFTACILLAGFTWVVFGQTLRHEFVNYYDHDYVLKNAQVARGLTMEGIAWAFTHVHSANWHPLTWISHMVDCQLYGLNAGGHHLSSLLLHAGTAILLFLVLLDLTSFLWRSFLVAALFAIHPLHVESVAWVAERKDVLSGLFFVLTLGAYTRYARKRWSPVRYALVFFSLALGLMCKPMLVTTPFLLLLLDYWPLRRTPPLISESADASGIWRRLILEKLPLLGLSLASCAITLFAQRSALQPITQMSALSRLGNSVISYTDYLHALFWPADLAVLYPWEAQRLQPSHIIISLLLIAGISAGVFILRRWRFLLTGWLWYLIMLVPVIGIVQVGNQARAQNISAPRMTPQAPANTTRR